MVFIYEEDGVEIRYSTDATSLYENYSHGDGVLGHFLRFLAAANYTFDALDELTIIGEDDVVVGGEQYHIDMEELDELRKEAKSVSTTELTCHEITDCDDKWIEWGGGEQPVERDVTVEYQTRGYPNYRSTAKAWEIDWSHNDDEVERGSQVVRYRVVE